MKTYRQLYPRVCTFETLYRAYRKARKGKRGRAEVAGFEFRLVFLAHNFPQLAGNAAWSRLGRRGVLESW